MPKRAEGGQPGAAQLGSYTYALMASAYVGLGSLVRWDLDHGRHLCTALGVQSNFAVWAWLVVGQGVTLLTSTGLVVALYKHYTGREYVEDRVGYAKSAASDLNFWCTLATFAGLVWLSAVLPPGLSWFRAVLIVLVAAVLGRVLTGLACVAVFSALYAPRPPALTFAGGPLCQQSYPPNGRCTRPVYGGTNYCRWHTVLHQFRRDISQRPWTYHSLMFGSGLSVAAACYVGAFLPLESGLLRWFLVVGFLAGGAKVFADAIIARDYPLSQFAFWAKLLAGGMLLEAVAELAAAALICLNPERARPLAAVFGEHPTWLSVGPSVLASALVVEAALMARMFVGRVLFLQPRLLGTILWYGALMMVLWAFDPFLRQLSPLKPEEREQFWAAAVGDARWPMAVAWFLAFNLCEMINVGMRRAALSPEAFKATVWESFPVCTGAPVLALFAGRYVLVWSGLHGAGYLIVVTLALSVPLCVWGTRWVMSLRTKERGEVKGAEVTTGQVLVTGLARAVLSEPDLRAALGKHRQDRRVGGPPVSLHLSGRGVGFAVVSRDESGTTAVMLLEEMG